MTHTPAPNNWTSTVEMGSHTASNTFPLGNKNFNQAILAIELTGVSWDFGELVWENVVMVSGSERWSEIRGGSGIVLIKGLGNEYHADGLVYEVSPFFILLFPGYWNWSVANLKLEHQRTTTAQQNIRAREEKLQSQVTKWHVRLIRSLCKALQLRNQTRGIFLRGTLKVLEVGELVMVSRLWKRQQSRFNGDWKPDRDLYRTIFLKMGLVCDICCYWHPGDPRSPWNNTPHLWWSTTFNKCRTLLLYLCLFNKMVHRHSFQLTEMQTISDPSIFSPSRVSPLAGFTWITISISSELRRKFLFHPSDAPLKLLWPMSIGVADY